MRFSNVAKLTFLGNPALRKVCQPVDFSHHRAQVKTLATQLTNTMKTHCGVGIAAPQINTLLRVFIMSNEGQTEYKTIVNPVLESVITTSTNSVGGTSGTSAAVKGKVVSEMENEKEWGWEGCLSIPGFLGYVPRFRNIKVSYLDVNGIQKSETLQGFEARVFQHELDHLNGIVYIDRLVSTQHLIVESEFSKHAKHIEKSSSTIL
ncbi:mitochondrial peptide deformylase [Andalucia godoyi]|uniref:Peptide deformylase n=1 Tax=Andalucia godoyi TaxID=505711 RepID=A0A8K0AHW6_ANDGO|nr:mitochondrial peptide deformylase [Andalucia godoyi]|eukprot:ANDGO_04435.mRNA.1 mitochondrial peptide deformylase